MIRDEGQGVRPHAGLPFVGSVPAAGVRLFVPETGVI